MKEKVYKVLYISFLLLLIGGFYACEEQQGKETAAIEWVAGNDRHWLGDNLWGNRLQDWKVQNGRLECIAGEAPSLMMRTVHLLNQRVGSGDGNLELSFTSGECAELSGAGGAAGILIGAGPELDVKGASLIQNRPGAGGGIFVGLSADGKVMVWDHVAGKLLAETPVVYQEANICKLDMQTLGDRVYLSVFVNEEKVLEDTLSQQALVGNIGMASFGGSAGKHGYWFNDFSVSGSLLKETGIHLGPIVGTQYTLSEQVLKMSVQLMPVGTEDGSQVYLESVNEAGDVTIIDSAEVQRPGYVAVFRVEGWDDTKDVNYRVNYQYLSSAGEASSYFWEGMVRKDPKEKEELVIAGFTGNHIIDWPGMSTERGSYTYTPEAIWYPHNDLVERVKKHEPDVLFFSGDQIYEGASPTRPDRKHLELDYLYRWYLYMYAFRDLSKNTPTVSIPDDHDVYQGNLWGAGGRSTNRDNKGGYVHPAWFVRMVELTQCGNLPDAYDPSPIDQGIGVYYTDMVYGGVGFAILEDRKFKSGCADNTFVKQGRPDHIIDMKFDIKKIDMPGKTLLGDRQLDFLHAWGKDWKGHSMKIVFSQTIFANMATHHGQGLSRVRADLDSNGWPQTGRNKAVDALRRCFAFHLAGDQHLGSMVQHGVDAWDDAMYSLCVPSIANFYPRVWWPEEEGKDRDEGSPGNLGKHVDGFGNLVTVYAVTNPSYFTEKSTGKVPLALHDKAPGYGIVKMNKVSRNITMECWPRWAMPGVDKPYEGWPKTIKQSDNYGRKAQAYLPRIIVEGVEDPVVHVVNEQSGELEYAIRAQGNYFDAKVFDSGKYTVVVSVPEENKSKTLTGVVALPKKAQKEVRVELK